MQNSIVVIAEHADGRIRPVTYELIAFARKLQELTSQAIRVLILGADLLNLAHEIADRSSQDVTAFEIPDMPSYDGELYSRVLAEHLRANRPAYVCIAHTSRGQDFAPVLAVELGAACISGVEDVLPSEEGVGFARPLYGGKIMAGIRPVSETAVLAVQPGIFKFVPPTGTKAGSVDIRSLSVGPKKSRFLGIKESSSDTAGITEAEVIIAAGQGIGDRDNLDIIHQLASLFNKAAVAGSRIVCDLGWLEYRCQVGVTGASVAPRLYIACGISGAIQHLTGMRGSEFIVAINKDPAAAIFQVADICIVDDLTTFIPKFIGSYLESRAKHQTS
ncbi:MAG: electron transfer flavoprotein subunit alpha/FixB family protein [Desulfobacterales bacterium]|nr:MAG: electron transfer flavoprotein subunit alpha/FixB family protein [Desulfobacterales bacterium]